MINVDPNNDPRQQIAQPKGLTMTSSLGYCRHCNNNDHEDDKALSCDKYEPLITL